MSSETVCTIICWMYKETKIAISAAKSAGRLLKKELVKRQKESFKAGGFQDIVTSADFLAENIIKTIIHHNFPHHAILSEETSADIINLHESKHLWIVDPLDGTIAFAAGLPFYSVSVAYLMDQQVVSSALYLAATDEVLWAQTGGGAFNGTTQIKVTDLPWKKCVIAFDPGNIWREKALTMIAAPLSSGVRFLQISSGEAGNLGLVARGSIQGLVCVKPDVWDYAAGIHLVKEAGGVVSDLKGKPYKMFSTKGHVAATPTAHKEIIRYTTAANF